MLGFLAILIVVPAVELGYIVLAEQAIARMPRSRQSKVQPWVWLGPAFVFLAIFVVYPALQTLCLSFLGPRSDTFVGLRNYAFALTSSEMRIALRNNLLWLVIFTSSTVGLGLVMAVLADRVRYEAAVKSALFLPMAISFVAAGVIWKFVYEFRPAGTPQIGLLNALLVWLVPGFQPVAWLVHPALNNLALIAVAVWVWVGFCLVILSAALKAIPGELLEAARVDGAGEGAIFRRVIIPLLGPTITVAATTMLIFALKAFDIVYVMTNGNFGTEVIANRMYKEMFNFRDFGRAGAIAMLLFAATGPAIIANLRRFTRQEMLR